MNTTLANMRKNAKIYVAGHTGLVGSALMRILQQNNYTNVIVRTKEELDLRNQLAVETFFMQERPAYIFLAAAHVGGIKANATYPAQFLYDNVMIEANVIHAAYRCGAKLLFLGSSCIYPRLCPQPILEEYLLTGPLEETNKAYAVAKIAGIILCESYNKQYNTCFISCMPTNLYGPCDNFDPENSHVIPGLIGKMHRAKLENKPYIELWGTGQARREFLFVDDLAEAVLFLMNNYTQSEPINVGVGVDITIYELAHLIKEIVGFEGEIVFKNDRYFDGTPQKLLSVDRLRHLGWQAKTSLKEGLCKTYDWYMQHHRQNKEKQITP